MIVRDVLAVKGSSVVTIDPAATGADLVGLLAEHGIGAVVVSSAPHAVDGIVSERDIARALHARGAECLSMPVSSLMTAEVKTCAPGDQIREVATVMTHGRFRHLPVVDDGALVGVVSIGDIVKSRIDELETQSDALMDYLTS